MAGNGQELSDTEKKKIVMSEEDKVPKTSFKPIALPEKLNAYHYTYDEISRRKRLMYEDLMRISISVKMPITLWGPPGAGKTKTIQAFANECDEDGVSYQVITVQPSTEDSTVFNGIMTVIFDHVENKHITEKSIPRVAEQVWEEYKYHRRLTIMFLDEMTTCVPAQQHAMLGLLTDGTYGPIDISPYVTFVMAANPSNTVPEVINLGNQVINRGGHIPWFSDQKRWFDLYKTGFGNPNRVKSDDILQDLENYLAMSDGNIFGDVKKELLENGDEDIDEDEVWTEDNLVPYEQIYNSERSLTGYMELYETLVHALIDIPYETRRMYVAECARAFLGEKGERLWTAVFDLRSQRVDITPVVNAVTRAGVDFTASYDDINSKLGDSLHRMDGRMMTSEKELEMAQQFEKKIYDGRFAIQRYLAFWVWLTTSTNEATRAQVIPIAIKIMMKAAEAAGKHQEIPRSNILPGFVPATIKQEIQELWTQYNPQATEQ